MFDLLKKKIQNDDKVQKIVAVIDGNIFPLEEVNDPAFAILGDGIAFAPVEEQSVIVSPVNGKLTGVFPTGHVFGVIMENGAELLIHIGIDTVEAHGRGFKILAEAEQSVKAGDPIVWVDFAELKKEYDMSVMLIITNDNQRKVKFFKEEGNVESGCVIGEI